MMNKNYAELQLRLRRSSADTFAVEPQFREPGHEVFVEDEPGKVTFDLDALNEVLNDISAYGNQLTQSFFAHANVLSAFNNARTAVERVNGQLRVRLFIEASDSELHNLRWETLRDPRDGAWLLTSERILFSRYLRSPDWRSVRLRPRG
jgi:hypothetical protein